MSTIVDGSNLNTKNPSELFYKIQNTKSCVKCDFRNDRYLKETWKLFNPSFQNYNFKGSTFPERIESPKFDNCDLTDANFQHSEINNGKIVNSNCTNANFKNCIFTSKFTISNSNLTNSNFSKMVFDFIKFGPNINFNNTNFNEAFGNKIKILNPNDVSYANLNNLGSKQLIASFWNTFYYVKNGGIMSIDT